MIIAYVIITINNPMGTTRNVHFHTIWYRDNSSSAILFTQFWYMDISITQHYHRHKFRINFHRWLARISRADILIILMGNAISGNWWSSNHGKVFIDFLFSFPLQAHLVASFHFQSLFLDIRPIVLDDRNFTVYISRFVLLTKQDIFERRWQSVSPSFISCFSPSYLNFFRWLSIYHWKQRVKKKNICEK